MTIKEMQERKRELGYNNEMIAKKSGVPLSTVQKIFGGFTKSPRRETIEALEKILAVNNSYSFSSSLPKSSVLRETAGAYAGSDHLYTIKDIEDLPEDVRAELIDGQIYYLATPVRIHQQIISEMLFIIKTYIKAHNGSCRVYPSPFAVYLNGENGRDYLEPDLVVICSPDKLHDKGCMGAPDWVMEVISPSTRSRDYMIKLIKYRTAGVKEYWIVDPGKKIVHVYRFGDNPETMGIYTFEDYIPFGLFPGLTVRMEEIMLQY